MRFDGNQLLDGVVSSMRSTKSSGTTRCNIKIKHDDGTEEVMDCPDESIELVSGNDFSNKKPTPKRKKEKSLRKRLTRSSTRLLREPKNN